MESNVSLPSNREFFANACFVCHAYGKSVNLKRCARCKMVAYCKREHQIEHWAEHKPLCRILSGKLSNGLVYEMIAENDDEAWSRAKATAISLAHTVLSVHIGRGLLPIELELLAYPRSCDFCHETDFAKLTDCPDCPDTSFCINHPRDSSHSAKCQVSQFFFDTHQGSPCFSNPILTLKYGETMPKDMQEATCLFALHCHVENSLKLTKIWYSILSDRLSRPYTFMHAVQKLNRPKFHNVTIHVVGASPVEMESVCYWHHILHHDEAIKELNVIFVGAHLTNGPIEIDPCKECTEKNRRFSISNVKNTYMVFANEKSFKKPDYIIRFNLEINYSHESLRPTLKAIAKIGCPLFITTIGEDKSVMNKVLINEVFGKIVPVLHCADNPFAGWKPYKDYQSEEFYYSNRYLIIYEKLS